MDIVRRVQDILLKPRDTWPTIATESTDAGTLYKQYLLILAAIPAVAGFIGSTMVGMGGVGMTFRVPVLTGLTSALIGYVLTLVMIYVLALIVDALAPSFGGTRDRDQALKLVAYGSTAALVAGVVNLVPALAILGLIAAFYSIYLIYVGIPTLMKCPADKAAAYTAVVAVLGIVASIVITAIAAVALPTPMGPRGGMMGAAGNGTVTIGTPEGQVTIDPAKIEALAKQMEAAGETAAKAAGNAAAVAMVAVPSQTLKEFLPAKVGDFERESLEAIGNGSGMPAMASATYRDGERSLTLNIVDVGSGAGALMGMWAAVSLDRETNEEVEKVYRQGQRAVREEYRKDGSRGEYQVILPNGTMVGAEGEQVDFATLKAAVNGLDIAKIEALQRTTK